MQIFMDMIVAVTFSCDLEERMLVGMGIIFHWQIIVPFYFKLVLFTLRTGF
jgi:hypothetical protein